MSQSGDMTDMKDKYFCQQLDLVRELEMLALYTRLTATKRLVQAEI